MPVNGIRTSSLKARSGNGNSQVNSESAMGHPEGVYQSQIPKDLEQSVDLDRTMSKKIKEFRRIFEEYQSIRSFYQKKNGVSADQIEFELQQSILLDLTDVIEDHILR